MGSDECKTASQRKQQEEAKHSYCTWNCSVQRAKKFYERRRAHQTTIDRQMKQLEELEQRISDAKASVEAASQAADAACPLPRRRQSSFNSVFMGKTLSLADYEVADLCDPKSDT